MSTAAALADNVKRRACGTSTSSAGCIGNLSGKRRGTRRECTTLPGRYAADSILVFLPRSKPLKKIKAKMVTAAS
jgi:hypothetical protein